jgi:hypothetical protein
MAGLHNDMWALDVGAVIANGYASGTVSNGWVQIFPDQAGANYPSPRRDFLFDVVGHVMIIFGGWTGAGMSHMNDLWYFMPGNLGGPLVANTYANAFHAIATVEGVQGKGIITPRAGMSYGIYGDNIVIFGGFANGGGMGFDPELNDLWVCNIPSQMWYNFAPVAGQPWPMPAQQTYATGLLIGRHMYVMVNTATPPAAAAVQLWRWTTPIASASSGAYNGGSASPAPSSVAGATAGFTISILVGLGNLLIAALLAQNAGLLTLPSFGGYGGGKATSAGYYSSTPASANDYSPPL